MNPIKTERLQACGPARVLALSASILVALVACMGLGACSGSVGESDIARLKAQMASSFQQNGQKIVLYKLSSDSATQVSGMVHVEIPSATGTRTFYTTCLATMDPASRQFTWHCDTVP